MYFYFLQDDGNSLNMVSGSDWTNIIIPGDLADSGFHHEKSFLLTDLVKSSFLFCNFFMVNVIIFFGGNEENLDFHLN